MTAESLLRSGDLPGALTSLEGEIRANPTDAGLRVFLFQLLCLEGQWTRAVQQLKTCVTLDPKTEPMARMYREAIVGEVAREKVFQGIRAPVFGDAEANWLPVLYDSLAKEAAGDLQGATALRAMAFRAAPAAAGILNDQPFDWIADADPRLGPALEIISGGSYQWVPFAALARITQEPPCDLRDLVWTSVHLTYRDGREAIGLVPTRYPGSQQGTVGQKLARETGWLGDETRNTAGIGQRMLCTEETDLPFLELREMTFSTDAGARRHG